MDEIRIFLKKAYNNEYCDLKKLNELLGEKDIDLHIVHVNYHKSCREIGLFTDDDVILGEEILLLKKIGLFDISVENDSIVIEFRVDSLKDENNDNYHVEKYIDDCFYNPPFNLNPIDHHFNCRIELKENNNTKLNKLSNELQEIFKEYEEKLEEFKTVAIKTINEL